MNAFVVLLMINIVLTLSKMSVACVADETKSRCSPSANQGPKACSEVFWL